jgi:hypothetical protein
MAADGVSPKDYIRLQPGRWMLGIRISKLPWIPLYTDAADGRALFDANSQSKEIEVVHLGCGPTDSVWFFKLARDGNTAIDFACAKGAKVDGKFTFPGAEPALIKGCSTGEDVFQRLCDLYAISLPLPRVCPVDSHLEVLGKAGKPIRTRGYIYVWGRDQPREHSPANEVLAKAIDERDPAGIRAAVVAGASLTESTRNNSFPPLLEALHQCDKPRGKACVELLLKLGCVIEGTPGDTPTIIACCRQFVPESLTIKMLEIVLPHRINVNARDSSGQTPLFTSAVHGRKAAVQLLLQHGADPTIADDQDRLVQSEVERLYSRAITYAERESYAQILCMLKGVEYKPPIAKPLAPKLATEMERLRACNAALDLLGLPIHLRPTEDEKAAVELLATPTIFISEKPARFERIGFYLTVSEWDAPDNSTADVAKLELTALEEKARPNSQGAASDFAYMISRAVYLLGMRHLQFEGAPQSDDFIQRGCGAAIAMFKILAVPGNRELRVDNITELMEGLLMAALLGRWKDFENLCELAPARLSLKAPQDIDDLTSEHVNAMLSFVSDFRKAKFPGTTKMEQVVWQGDPKRPKQLLTLWHAIRENDTKATRRALETSLTQFSKRERKPSFYGNTGNVLAVEESVMCIAAKRRGIDIPQLEESLSDYLVTSESIKVCSHD